MFKKIFCSVVLLNVLSVYAYTTNYYPNNNFNSKLKMNTPRTITTTRSNNHFMPYYPNNNYLSRSNLKALEKYALNQTFGRESDLQRLERLENLAFGATQMGNLNQRFKNVENAILSRPKYNTKNSVLKNLANYFAGQATGFTPDIMNYPTYNNLGGFSTFPNSFMPTPRYNNQSFEQYSNGIFGGGWGMRGHDFGTGTGVRILD